MKITILTLIFTFIFGSLMQVEAKTGGELILKLNEQKKAVGSKIKVRFIEVLEDSRCPEGVDCVWAGNAKVKIAVSKNGGSIKTFELNTGMGEQINKFEGYDIKIKDLTPHPKADRQGAALPVELILTIEKSK